MRRVAPLLVFLLLAGAVPARADVSQGDVEQARENLRQVRERLSEQVARYDAAVAEEAALRDRMDRLLVQLTARERDLVAARRAARDRAAEMYMSAGSTPPPGATSDEVASQPTRYVYLESVSQTDRDLVNRLEVARRDYEHQRTIVDEAIAEQADLGAEMEALVSTIYDELEQANSEYTAIRTQWEQQEAERIRREQEEAERQAFLATSTTTTTTRAPSGTTTTVSGSGGTNPPASTTTTAPAPTTTAAPTTTVPPKPAGTRVCPVDGATTFTNSWGDPRPGGRTHTGTDLLASEGTPLVAVEAGYIWSPSWHSAGGLGLYIKGDSGDLWYYAHLSSYVTGLVGGLRVEAGQRVGYVGHTGNASVPHLHLGWQPGGGALQNPYPVMDTLC